MRDYRVTLTLTDDGMKMTVELSKDRFNSTDRLIRCIELALINRAQPEGNRVVTTRREDSVQITCHPDPLSAMSDIGNLMLDIEYRLLVASRK